MSKYRIVTNGKLFMVQKKWGFLWMHHGWRTYETASYDNINAAMEHKLMQLIVEAKKTGKVQVVG